MNVGFITNIKKDLELNLTKKLVKFILDNNATPILTKKISQKLMIKCIEVPEVSQVFEKSDFIVVLGGDGTILRVARNSAYFDTKILGINIGNLGYLADVEQKDAYLAIKKVLNDNYSVEKRMMLDVTVENSEVEGQSRPVLNEVAISGQEISRMIKISVEINDKFVDSYRADGIIVSTPTGSTAYNLSAGGPILKPDTELIIINYICPHALFARPYVISGDDIVKISIDTESVNATMSLDGQQTVSIKNGEIIKIKKSSYSTNIIKTTSLNFFDILRRKMVDVRK